jgi:hypothetical protein
VWAAQSTIRVGDFHIGVRSSTLDGDATMRRLLADHVVDDPNAPANYSLLSPEPGQGRRGVYRLYEGSTAIARARSEARIFIAMVDVLAGHLDGKPRLVPLNVRPFLKGTEVILAPRETVSFLDSIEPRLRRLGVECLVHVKPKLDPSTGTVVLNEELLPMRREVFDELEDGSGPLRTHNGRFRIRDWIFFGADRDGDATLSPAVAVSRALGTVPYIPEHGSQRVLDGFAAVFGGERPARGWAITCHGAKDLADTIRASG